MSAPFGIEIHSPLAALEVLDELGEAKYIVNPPRRHPRFNMYIVQATDSLGVVWVKGISGEIEGDGYGFQIRALMDEVSTQLRRRYGSGTVSDYLFPDALWEGERDWVMSIAQHERSMSELWEAGKTGLPGDLEHVYLGITASDRDTAMLVLEYGSTDFEKAKQELQDSMSDLL